MSTPFEQFFSNCRIRCKQNLPRLLAADNAKAPCLEEACHYAVSSGGKYVRPLLVYSAGLAITDTNLEILDYPACAIEIIHTYSLIHDDLPAMDDDELRRGKPTVHKAFDEATAILAGDALQARAFEILTETPKLNAQQKIDMVRVLASAAGPQGMVAGQAIDIGAVNTDMSLTQLQSMHALKTGALIRAALALGGIAAQAGEEELSALDNYGSYIGLAFQIVDDILDVEGDTNQLGKTQGKDAQANKPTYVKLMGLDGAKAEAKRLLTEALASLDCFSESANHLRDLARYIIERKN